MPGMEKECIMTFDDMKLKVGLKSMTISLFANYALLSM